MKTQLTKEDIMKIVEIKGSFNVIFPEPTRNTTNGIGGHNCYSSIMIYRDSRDRNITVCYMCVVDEWDHLVVDRTCRFENGTWMESCSCIDEWHPIKEFWGPSVPSCFHPEAEEYVKDLLLNVLK